MKTLYSSLINVACFCLISGLLGSCDWELPSKKEQRNCTKPAGTLKAQSQQRKVDFSITGSSGTIDRITWDFGSSGAGSTTATTGMTASYTYPNPGTYTVKATLSNTCNQETVITLQVTVANAAEPTVSLQPITNITLNSASTGMTITSYGNATVTRYGVCYSSTNQMPTTADAVQFFDGSKELNTSVPFSLTGLQPNTTYYVRSYAVNQAGTGYSSTVQTFKTGSKPSVSVAGTPTVGVTNSNVNFVVLNAGNPSAVEYGICYSSSNSTPDVTNSTVVPVNNVIIGATTTTTLAPLTPNTRYYYRAYAKLNGDSPVYSPTTETFVTQVDPLSLDLIASVSFTDRSLQDVSGNNNNINLIGSPTFVTDHNGKANSAIQLNGLGDYFYMLDNSTLNPNAFSMSIWIKPISLDLDPTGWMQIYNKSRFSDGANEMYSALIRPTIGAPGITINTDIKQGSNCQNGKWQTLTVASGIELNKWYHIVYTYDGGQTGRMYINGTLLYTKADFAPTGMDRCPGGELKFGAQGKSDTNYFYGAMDDIRMYRRALSESEVKILSNQ